MDYACRVEDRQSMAKLWLLVRFFLFVRCTYTYTCEVCKKALRITLQLKALLHTPQVYALFVSAYTLMPSDTHNPHFTDISCTDFCCKHNNLNMLFASSTL
jgi:hypothetical protein